jgi:transcriptional regulator with XRE-family HTH domain
MAQRPRVLTPEISARHRFGALVREWRQRRRLSQARLGVLMHVSADLVGKVEKAVRWPSRQFAADCDAALDTGGALVRLLPQVQVERTRHQHAPSTCGPAQGQARLLGPPVISDPINARIIHMRRRQAGNKRPVRLWRSCRQAVRRGSSTTLVTHPPTEW